MIKSVLGEKKIKEANLINREMIEHRKKLRSDSRKSPDKEQHPQFFDKIFQKEDDFKNKRRDKRKENDDYLITQIARKVRDKQNERAYERSCHFEAGLNLSGDVKNTRVLSEKDLHEEIKKQIEENKISKREKQQKDREIEKTQAELMMRVADERERSASTEEKQKQKEYREIIEKGIAEKQALKNLEKSDKCIERREIDLTHSQAVEAERKQRESRRNFMNTSMNALKKQIEDNKRKKSDENVRSRELITPPIDSSKENLLIEDKLPDQLTQRRLLKESLLKQIEEKKRDRVRQKQLDTPEDVSPFVLGNNFKNPYIDQSKLLTQALQHQISSKLAEKEQQLKEAKDSVVKAAIAAKNDDELKKKLWEDNQKMKKELNEGLLHEMLQKERKKKEQWKRDRSKDLEVENAISKKLQEHQDIIRLMTKKSQQEYRDTLIKQIKSNAENKKREKSQETAYDTTFDDIINKLKKNPKLYSCADCTQKYPKNRMTKKKALKLI